MRCSNVTSLCRVPARLRNKHLRKKTYYPYSPALRNADNAEIPAPMAAKIGASRLKLEPDQRTAST
jgi:hypothetical protein